MGGWYETIEPGIREQVRLLRENGINTTYSCEHAMVIEAENYQDADLTHVARLLSEAGYEEFLVEIQLFVKPGKGMWQRTLVV